MEIEERDRVKKNGSISNLLVYKIKEREKKKDKN